MILESFILDTLEKRVVAVAAAYAGAPTRRQHPHPSGKNDVLFSKSKSK